MGARRRWSLRRALIGPIERGAVAPRVPFAFLSVHRTSKAARQVKLQFASVGRSNGALGYSRPSEGKRK